MAVACNLGRTDRALRIALGIELGGAAGLARAPLYGTLLLAVAGMVVLVEGILGH